METINQSVVELAQLMSASRKVDDKGKPFVVIPATAIVKDLEDMLPAPIAKRASVTLGERESFTRYVNEHKTPTTRLCRWMGSDNGFTAVLDFHEPGEAGKGSWNRHQAVFGLRTSPQFKLWWSKNGAKFTQKAFAEFLEDNYPDITDPAGAAVLDIANNLEVLSTSLFKSGQRLNNSTETLHYEKQHSTKAGEKGDIEVPRQFTLTIPIFYGEPSIAIQARLKYSLDDGRLTFWYELVRAQQAVDASIDGLAVEIEAATGLKPYVGKLT